MPAGFGQHFRPKKGGFLMEHLIEKVSHNRLLKGVMYDELMECARAFKEYLEDEKRQKVSSTKLIAATAYALGIREGVHRERARMEKKVVNHVPRTAVLTLTKGGDAA